MLPFDWFICVTCTVIRESEIINGAFSAMYAGCIFFTSIKKSGVGVEVGVMMHNNNTCCVSVPCMLDLCFFLN